MYEFIYTIIVPAKTGECKTLEFSEMKLNMSVMPKLLKVNVRSTQEHELYVFLLKTSKLVL